MEKLELYIVLGIRPGASNLEIKRAFRRLARRFHPDINPGNNDAEEQFKKISEAYEVLSDPRKREFYDENGFYAEGVLERHSEADWMVSFEGFDFGRSDRGAYAEVFDHLFRRPDTIRQAARGADLEHQLSIGFEDAFWGTRTKVDVTRRKRCDPCRGQGSLDTAADVSCTVCAASGKVVRLQGHLRFAVTCADCGGVGRRRPICPQCAGEGRFLSSDTVPIELSPGVQSGARIVIPGKGDAGKYGGATGDLWITVTVSPHPFFERMGDNLFCTVPISLSEAVLGAKIEVPGLDTTEMLRVPPGTQSGQKLKLRGKGFPSPRDPGVRGDQYVEVRIVIPRVQDERSREILREFSRLNIENPRQDMWWHHGKKAAD